MTEANSSKSQEDYVDDFEKELDWLIKEEGQNEEQGSDYGDIDAEIDKELEKEETPGEGIENENKNQKPENEERWPSPMEPVGSDIEQESTSLESTSLHTETPSPEINDQPDEEQMYILDKIEQANKELQEQDTPDMKRQKGVHFKDTLVDLVVPPLFSDSNSDDTDEEQERALIASAASVVSGMLSNLIIDSSGQISTKDKAKVSDAESEVSQKRSELYTSDTEGEVSNFDDTDEEQERALIASAASVVSGMLSNLIIDSSGQISIKDKAEVSDADSEVSRKISELTSSPYDESKEFRRFSGEGLQETKESKVLVEKDAPRPPTKPKVRPTSASQGQRETQMRNGKRRVQSATGTPSKATFALSPQQKELLQKTKERKERLAREAEQRKREKEELRRQENEQAFKRWLIRKREQIFEERKIHRAKDVERMNAKRDFYDPEEAYRSWMKKKTEQVQKERQILELRKMEEDCSCLMHSRQDCDHAFNLWLKRKHEEKRAKRMLALEHSRRVRVEVRRARRMTELIYAVSETRPFQFTDDSAYRY
ncbi:coiled-coil domain-containing protein 181 [Poeciliopsis prolifica]|uniref:coiled-coil domain-containing protein 181 n=1 Tax=Poeciliopsis prolifica TaxID=188132 RepID=UPI002413485E|nr:coiled-coil domain-containing protein 181 [Poeciliopsis prolifica]XP_054905734.1 coiled-coil domain-containing protein 181 [Poeciliopsis prolifica]XP_054905742.1 coiled-coil domain-containing protein 181 [Poeciliopsis prolifica]XP_054905750.1 coiled-coil domain-containing protein 181 [Poeciliopsis prolifica]